jgi:Ni,Fe-hydrogenase III small subunit/NAD-dependent dihydropyrimidine dehydrogenase PreA subunit
MLNLLKLRFNQRNQTIPDVKKVILDEKFKGFPILNGEKCIPDCSVCLEICPTDAILLNPLRIDLGKCIFCGDCERECPKDVINFTNFYKTASTSREYLVVDESKNPENYQIDAIKVKKEIQRIFGKSLKLRSVSAGGCNACEMELNACSNINFDMGRFGIEFVASPRHADGIVITGPIPENMAKALEDAYMSVPNPKIVVAVGTCAISGGLFADSGAINRKFSAPSIVVRNPASPTTVRDFEKYNVDLYVPGCPPHPLTFINGILDFLGRKY